MKIAIISDIHGNISALEAVLRDLERQGNADHIVVTGDMFSFGPAPDQVLVKLEQLPRAQFLLGNTDRYLLERTYPSLSNGDDWQDRLLLSFQWTAKRLGDEGFDFLKSLVPFSVIQDRHRQLLAVHGSPRSDEEGLTIQTETSDFAVDPQVSVIVGGHTHVPMDRSVGDVRFVNAGSVGIPFDGDPRACYALISNVAANGCGPTQVELRRVPYDIEAAVGQLYAHNHPAADIGAYNLRTARSIGSNLIYTAEMRQRNRN
jgi:putative phosphoesterase